MMPLKVVILEDQESDAELVKYHVSTLDYDFEFRLADSEKGFLSVLDDFVPDLILSDYRLNGYDGLRALEHCRVVLPHVPFIMITGTLGEELAVKIIKKGANDFLLKGKITDLPLAIIRALREAQQKREGIKVQEERDLLFTMSIDLIGIAGSDGYFKTINPAFERTLGYSAEELLSRPFIDFIHPDDKKATLQEVEKLKESHQTMSFINRNRCKNGNYKWLEWNVALHGDRLFINARDMTERIRAQDEILKLNLELEQKVAQRTEELSVANNSLKDEILERIHTGEILEEKNREITDSINYAKRIQQAKLPNKELIHSHLPQSFILFKPKDIVSGDFYFFHKNEQSVFIASADCTGHGVPGAFMSMIAFEKLEDAFLFSTDTSEILGFLNKKIKAALHQSGNDESMRDGMDIALCSIDTDNCTLTFSGANRPLWIIRKGQNNVEEWKGTRKAIGGFTDDAQHFESHKVQLKKGDSFYIFSDGYADTFGGESGKKLTPKRFKDLLLDISHKPMQEQEQLLDSFLESWKSGVEQMDDILVIGVKL